MPANPNPNPFALRLPDSVILLTEETDDIWTNRMQLMAFSKDVLISQNRADRYWICSCRTFRAWANRNDKRGRRCPHIEELGLPGKGIPGEFVFMYNDRAIDSRVGFVAWSPLANAAQRVGAPPPMNPIVYLPRGTTKLPIDLIVWTNRFRVPSESGSTYILAQRTEERWWACSCPSYTRKAEGQRDCKHLRKYGIPGNQRPVELILCCMDGSFTIDSTGADVKPDITVNIKAKVDPKAKQLLDRIAQRSARLTGKLITKPPSALPPKKDDATTRTSTTSPRRIVLDEDL